MVPEGLWCLQGAALRPGPGAHRRLLSDSLTMRHAEPRAQATFIQTRPDWIRKRPLLWAFPLGLAVIGWLMPAWRQTSWPAAFFWAGALCLGNALRCGRAVRQALNNRFSSIRPSPQTAAQGGRRRPRR